MHATENVIDDGHIKRAKQFFRYAQRKGFVASSPFGDIVAGSQHNDARLVFVTQETIARVLSACPHTEWRLLIALARFGGLRNPSETLTLRWQDINWAEDIRAGW